MSRVWDDGIEVQWPHPLRWLKYFVKAMLYGPSYSVYDEMRARYEGQTEAPGDGQSSRRGPRLQQGSRLQDDTDGFSDKDDESYYGMT